MGEAKACVLEPAEGQDEWDGRSSLNKQTKDDLVHLLRRNRGVRDDSKRLSNK